MGIFVLLAVVASDGLDVEQCVAVALGSSAYVKSAQAEVELYEARLREVEAHIYPRLVATMMVAPMFSIEFGDIRERQSETRWRNLRDWGPSLQAEAQLLQPITTFGRLSKGEEAAMAQVLAQKARVRDARNNVALEVRRFYYTHLYALSVLPAVDHAAGVLDESKALAREAFEEGTGQVTPIDLAKIRWGISTLQRVRGSLENARDASLLGLKQVMGLAHEDPLALDARRLPRQLPGTDPSLEGALLEAATNRPEWAFLSHGRRAAEALGEAELLANMPTLAVLGHVRAAWTPTVTPTDNYFHHDPYNDIFGGVALALQFDLAPATTVARADQASAFASQLEAMQHFAATGIPRQVKKAHQELSQAREQVGVAEEGSGATQQWLRFAVNNLAMGVGEANDVLEGLAAYVEAKNTEYDARRSYYVAQSELLYAVGRASDEPAAIGDRSGRVPALSNRSLRP